MFRLKWGHVEVFFFHTTRNTITSVGHGDIITIGRKIFEPINSVAVRSSSTIRYDCLSDVIRSCRGSHSRKPEQDFPFLHWVCMRRPCYLY